MRKANLARLLVGRPDGIFLSPFEQGEIGPDLFRKACEFGAGGLVSKHRDRPYQGGRLGESNHGDFNCHKLFRWKRDVGPKCSIPLLPKHLEVSGDAIHGVGPSGPCSSLLEICSHSARIHQREMKPVSAEGGRGADRECTACALCCGGLTCSTEAACCVGDAGGDDTFCLTSSSTAWRAAMFCAICSCLAAS